MRKPLAIPFLFCLVPITLLAQQGVQSTQIVTMLTKAEPPGLPIVPTVAYTTLAGVADPMRQPQADFADPTHLLECDAHIANDPDLVCMKNQMAAEREEELVRLDEMGDIPDPFAPNPSVLSAAPAMVVSSFNAINVGSGNPADNTMAISNDGAIITCINSRVAVYSTTGAQMGVWSLSTFFNYSGSGVVNDFYDPSIIYDPGADRFVFTCSVGRQSANSRLCVAFSQSNNPAAGWWIFFLSGNPFNNNCWWDYPRIGLNESEIFITGNLYNNTGNYINSAIYQISKTAGYAGNGSSYGVYSILDGSPFALIPVTTGTNTNYGYPFYLVTHNPISGSTTQLYKISNPYASGLASISYNSINVPAYSIGGNAGQKGTSEKLNTNDCRALSAFYLNGLIHYVFHSKVPGSGTFNGLFYHRLDPTALSVTSRAIYVNGYDLVFPSAAWAGTDITDKSILISFEYSTTNSYYPGIGAINVDDALATSGNLTQCGVGSSYVDLTGTTTSTSRWGDYTGICRKRNTSPARIWGCASFGNATHTYTAKIFQLGASSFTGNIQERSTDPEIVPDQVGTSIQPNPALPGTARLDMEKPLSGSVEIEIISLAGQIVGRMQQDDVPQGHSQFQLPTENLAAGVYFVRVFTNRQLVRTQKLIILH